MKNLITFSFLVLLFLTSCEKERISANGNVTSETRDLNAFTGVHTSGSTPINIVYGNEYKVVIKGSSNLIPHYESDITNGRLYLNYERVNVKNSDIEVTVTMPSIKNISLSGSSKIEIIGNFPLIDIISLSISGSGDIKLKDPATASLADIDISGSGNVDFEKLTCARAEVSISGSGDARIAVVDRLKAGISGSGKVYYTGNPVVESHISGSGKVIQF